MYGTTLHLPSNVEIQVQRVYHFVAEEKVKRGEGADAWGSETRAKEAVGENRQGEQVRDG